MDKIKQCDLFLPNSCMLRCKMCEFWKNDPVRQDDSWLGIEDYRRLFLDLDGICNEGFLVSFGGGEPLLYAERLFQISGLCRDSGFSSYFPTNAYLLDADMAKRISLSGVSSLGISLESMEEPVHDFLRGTKGSWKRAMDAVRFLQEYASGVQVNILTVINGHNIAGLRRLADWVYQHPFLHGIVFQAVQEPFNSSAGDYWRTNREYSFLWPQDKKQYCDVLDELITLRKTKERAYKISTPSRQMELFKMYFSDPQGFVKPRQCHLSEGIIRVDYPGDVFFCQEMGALGNLKESGIKELLGSPKAQGIKKRIRGCGKNCHHLVNCYYDGANEK